MKLRIFCLLIFSGGVVSVSLGKGARLVELLAQHGVESAHFAAYTPSVELLNSFWRAFKAATTSTGRRLALHKISNNSLLAEHVHISGIDGELLFVGTLGEQELSEFKHILISAQEIHSSAVSGKQVTVVEHSGDWWLSEVKQAIEIEKLLDQLEQEEVFSQMDIASLRETGMGLITILILNNFSNEARRKRKKTFAYLESYISVQDMRDYRDMGKGSLERLLELFFLLAPQQKLTLVDMFRKLASERDMPFREGIVDIFKQKYTESRAIWIQLLKINRVRMLEIYTARALEMLNIYKQNGAKYEQLLPAEDDEMLVHTREVVKIYHQSRARVMNLLKDMRLYEELGTSLSNLYAIMYHTIILDFAELSAKADVHLHKLEEYAQQLREAPNTAAAFNKEPLLTPVEVMKILLYMHKEIDKEGNTIQSRDWFWVKKMRKLSDAFRNSFAIEVKVKNLANAHSRSVLEKAFITQVQAIQQDFAVRHSLGYNMELPAAKGEIRDLLREVLAEMGLAVEDLAGLPAAISVEMVEKINTYLQGSDNLAFTDFGEIFTALEAKLEDGLIMRLKLERFYEAYHHAEYKHLLRARLSALPFAYDDTYQHIGYVLNELAAALQFAAAPKSSESKYYSSN